MSSTKSFDVISLPVQIICCIGILANLMLLIAFIKDPLKCFRNSATYLVGNLAFSDLLVNVVLITSTFLESENAVVVFLQYFSFYSSMLTIFSIALDRYLMITYPFKHRFLMSGGKMGIWIALIWFLSSVHPVKKIFIHNENDVNAKPGVGSVSVLFTAVLYGKTYFALRKQARSMIGKKTTFSSKQCQYAPNKSISMESETCVESENRKRAQNQDNRVQNGIERDPSLDERAENQYERAEIENERFKSHSEHDQTVDERADNQNHRAQNQYERAETENERAKSQSECNQSLDECAEDQNHRAEKQNDHAQNPYERAEIESERAKNHNQRAQNKNERVESQNERAQREDLSSNKRPKNSQVINNTKEQKFLNTIIIIACIAVVTVIPGTIYSLLSVTETNITILGVLSAIFCLNFAANPFVYCLRLKRYRKTFKIVYGCKR
jgi:hypothetical protein